MTAAITGWAWRTPLGSTIDGAIARLLAGERAARPNARFDASTYACTLAATIPDEPAPSRHKRFLRRMGLFALEAGAEALAGSAPPDERTGLFFGYGGLRAHWDDMMPALEKQGDDLADTWARGFKLFSPFWMLQHLSNNAHALFATDSRARGEGVTYGGMNAGAQALAGAIRALNAGAVDRALVVAYDSLVEPETLVELAVRGGATAARDLASLAAPYDARANGPVPGEAAAALLLERPEDAGARAKAFLRAAEGADGNQGEAHAATLAHVTRRMAAAGSVSVVDGAAGSFPALDAAERTALAEILGSDARLTATASAFGKCGAAAPLMQAIVLSCCMERGVLPGIAGLATPAAGPMILLARPEKTTARTALGISTGAPGLAAAVRVSLDFATC